MNAASSWPRDSLPLVMILSTVCPVTQKVDSHFLAPFGSNILKYLDPRIIYFNFVEIFGPPGTEISDFGPH